MQPCITSPSDDDCGCCNLPNTLVGFAALATYVVDGLTARATGTSTISQLDANQKAQAAAEAHMALLKSCGTAPIGALQLLSHEW